MAKLAGVSRSAVSRTFTPGAAVSPATRQKVLAASQQLQYVPNAAARSLMTKRTNLIAVVVSNQASTSYGRLLDCFSSRLMDIGYNVFLITAVENLDTDDQLLKMLRYPVDGFVITAAASLEFSRQICRHCIALGIPAVTLNRTIEGAELSSINCDHRAGGAMAVDTLIDGGLRRLGLIVGHEPTTVNTERMNGFLERAAERGIAEPAVVRARQFNFDGGYEAAAQLLGRHPDLEGLFCVNDQIAIGAMEMARKDAKLRVPEDLSIVGFDDMPAAAWPSFDLTTIRQPIDKMVGETLRVLMQTIEGDASPASHSVVPVEFVRRGSSR
ncbi:LacI family DNA-binding transcriptional regulator [Limimaricola pyoseonensis]|uniref:LacI family DNA-binding transcriptional regulator n=1 Tax=Limimaricola pyoseonensis TaxID=521013 RepID=UPI0013F4CBE2|nr:LacI family DNA-binding transcriptional regulator [Limimaricola pyoseonensis]